MHKSAFLTAVVAVVVPMDCGYGQYDVAGAPLTREVTTMAVKQHDEFVGSEPAVFIDIPSRDGVLRAPLAYLRTDARSPWRKQREGNKEITYLPTAEELSQVVHRTPLKKLGRTKFCHAEGGSAITFSPDSRSLISGGRYGNLRFFDISSGQLTKVLSGHESQVEAIAFIPNTNFAVSSSSYETIVWDVDAAKELQRSPGRYWTIAVSSDGQMICLNDQLFDIQSTKPFRLSPTYKTLGIPIPRMSFFTEDDRYLIIGSQNHGAWAWDVKTDQAKRIGNVGPKQVSVNDIRKAFGQPLATENSLLAVSTAYYNVVAGKQIDLQMANRIMGQMSDYFGTCFAVSPDGEFIAGIGNGLGIRVYNIEDGQFVDSPENGLLGIHACCFSDDGKTLAAGGSDMIVKLFNVRTGEVSKEWKAPSFIYKLRFLPNTPWLVVGTSYGHVDFWNTESGEVKRFASANRTHDIAIDAKTKTVMAVGSGGVVDMIHYDDEDWRHTRFSPGSADAAAIDPLRRFFIYASPFSGNVGDTTPNPRFVPLPELLGNIDKEQCPMPPYTDYLEQDPQYRLGQLKALDVSADAKRLAASDWRGRIRIWDLEQKRGHARFNAFLGVDELKFLPHSQHRIAVSDSGGVTIWDAESGKPLAILNADTGDATDVDITADGKLIATANDDGSVTIWDLASLKL